MDMITVLGYQRFDSRMHAISALDTALEGAHRRVRIFDDRGDFYGFDRRAFAEAIEGLLRGNREAEVLIVLRDTDFVQRHCPRLLELMARHGSRIRVLKVTGSVRGFARGFVVVDDSVVLRRPHFEQAVTFWDIDEKAIAAAQGVIDELLQHAGTTVSPHVTGL